MIPREAQSKYVSDVIKIHVFLQDTLSLLAKNTKKSGFLGFYCIYAVTIVDVRFSMIFPSNAKFTYNT